MARPLGTATEITSKGNIMRKFIAVALLTASSLAAAGVAHAAAPTVTKTYRTYASYTYTVSITDPAVSVSAGPRDGNPITTGGCVNQFRRKSNGQQLFLGTTCATPGTVKFTSPSFPVCETPFAIVVDGATVYTDLLNAPCPPPAPPAVIVTDAGATVTFTNPADVEQSASFGATVPSLACVYVADGPYTAQTSTRFAGIGLNRYVYFWAAVQVTVGPLSTVTATLVC